MTTRDRSGCTFLVTTNRRVYYAKCTGDDQNAKPPAHDRLAKMAGISIRDIKAGGAVMENGKVSWKSGSCTFSPKIKAILQRGQLAFEGQTGNMPQLRSLEFWASFGSLGHWDDDLEVYMNGYMNDLGFNLERLGLDRVNWRPKLDAISSKVAAEVRKNWTKSETSFKSFDLSGEDAKVLDAVKHRVEVVLKKEKIRIIRYAQEGNRLLAEAAARKKQPRVR